MKCKICEVPREIFKCDSCEYYFCRTCASLTASEVKVLQLNTRVMKFYCKHCEKLQTFPLLLEVIQTKEKLVESKDTIIANNGEIVAMKDELILMLKKEIEELKSKVSHGNTKMGYSEALKRSSEVLVVKPKKTSQTSSVTKQVVEEKINPSALGVGIAQMRYVREGGVAISCRKQKDVESISDNIREKLGEEYEVNIPKKKNPKIKIFNIEKKLLADYEELIEKIIVQNIITTPLPQRVMKIVDRYEDKNGKTNVIMEVDSSTYKEIAKREVLYIGWRTCRYVNHVNIIQCYRCWKFGHMAKDCKREGSICPKCAGEHKIDECQSTEEVCINCKNASEILKIPNINYRHKAFNRNCEAYRRIYGQLEQRVNYPEIYSTESQ